MSIAEVKSVWQPSHLSIMCVISILRGAHRCRPLASKRYGGAWNSLCSLINNECGFPSTSPLCPFPYMYPPWPSFFAPPPPCLVSSPLSSALIFTLCLELLSCCFHYQSVSPNFPVFPSFMFYCVFVFSTFNFSLFSAPSSLTLFLTSVNPARML